MRPAYDKSYFHFTRKERNGILCLTSLAILSVLTSIFYPLLFPSPPQPATAHAADIEKLKAKATDRARKFLPYKKDFKKYRSSSDRYENAPAELFYFDPNRISENEWRRLGVRDKTIGIIQNYLKKGGRFREAGDLKKIWGLHENLANRLIPYARITNLAQKQFASAPAFKKLYTPKSYQTININESDTSALTALPGIGVKLSQRIIKYRDKLGGFYSVDQVSETFGLADSTFKKIRPWLKVDKGSTTAINLNTATLEELKSHPYIRYHLANAMIRYREQHKGYRSVSEIRNIMLVDDTTYQKLVPYLTIE